MPVQYENEHLTCSHLPYIQPSVPGCISSNDSFMERVTSLNFEEQTRSALKLCTELWLLYYRPQIKYIGIFEHVYEAVE